MSDASKIFENVLAKFSNDAKWNNALFGGIKTISNTKVGNVGQTFIEDLCADLGLACSFPTNAVGERSSKSPWDIKISGVTFELKTATEDIHERFQFNHVRYHREYQALLCLGVSPANLYFDIWSKADIATGKAGKLVSMEKNANASYKLTKAANQLIAIDNFRTEIDKFIFEFKKKWMD